MIGFFWRRGKRKSPVGFALGVRPVLAWAVGGGFSRSHARRGNALPGRSASRAATGLPNGHGPALTRSVPAAGSHAERGNQQQPPHEKTRTCLSCRAENLLKECRFLVPLRPQKRDLLSGEQSP